MSHFIKSNAAVTRTAAIVLVSILMAGCATWSTGSVNQSTKQAAIQLEKTEARKILVSEADITDRTYDSVGDITVTVNKTTVFHPTPTRELVNVKLQEKAADLGADAVILVRYGEAGVSFFSWGSLEGKGRAIKFQP